MTSPRITSSRASIIYTIAKSSLTSFEVIALTTTCPVSAHIPTCTFLQVRRFEYPCFLTFHSPSPKISCLWSRKSHLNILLALAIVLEGSLGSSLCGRTLNNQDRKAPAQLSRSMKQQSPQAYAE